MPEDNRYSKSPGPYKEKADDFRSMETSKLLEKYQNDSEMHNALAAKGAAAKFADTAFKTEKEGSRFIEEVTNRIADNIEHGRIEEMKVKKYGHVHVSDTAESQKYPPCLGDALPNCLL